MKKLTPELAELLGLLCAEGCYILRYNTYFGKHRNKIILYKNHKSERIEFYNKDKKLIIRFKNLLAKEFYYYPNVTKFGKINICRRDIIRTILIETQIGHLKWEVPKRILNSNKLIKISFLRGYFDGDGTASKNIRMFSTNLSGLNQVAKILIDLKFDYKFEKPMIKENRKPLHYIQLPMYEKERFLKIIQTVSKRPDICGDRG